MQFVSANYIRVLTQAARHQKSHQLRMNRLMDSERTQLYHKKQLDSIYTSIQTAAEKGQASVAFPNTHLLWQTPSVQKFLKEKGFTLHPELHLVKWWRTG
jgi:hypothetical protein